MCHHTPLTCTGTPTAGASTTLGDGVEEAPRSATNKKAKKGKSKKGKAKKGKTKKGKAKKGKGKGKAKGNTDEWQSEDDTESNSSDGSAQVTVARGRSDRPRAKRGSSTHASYHYGRDDAESDYAQSVASADISNYSST